LDALEIKRLVPHSCRHTFASMMAKAGADTLAIQRIIGHADYATTANIYTHESVEELKKAINKI
jgi:site-specific recombinase XerD